MHTTLQFTLRRAFIKAITKHIEVWAGSQQAVIRKLGLPQPRLNTLLNGHADAFSLDMLVAIAAKAGLQVRVRVR